MISLACHFQCLTFYAECIQPTNGKCSRSFLHSSYLTKGSAKRVRETVFICFSSFCRIPITSTYLRGILWESNSITYILLISICIPCSKTTYWYWSNVQGMQYLSISWQYLDVLLKWLPREMGKIKKFRMFPLLIFTYSVLKMLGWKKMSFLPSSTCMHSNIWYYHALTTYIKHVNMTTSYRKTISDTKEEISESRTVE